MLTGSSAPAPFDHHHRSAPGPCATLRPTESSPDSWATVMSSGGERSAATDSWMASLFMATVWPNPDRRAGTGAVAGEMTWSGANSATQ